MLHCKIEIESQKYEVGSWNLPCGSAKLKSKVDNVRSELETSHAAVQRMKLEVGSFDSTKNKIESQKF